MNRWVFLAACWLFLAVGGWAQSTDTQTIVSVPVAPVFAQPGEASEQVTQVLFGDEVRVLDSQGGWVKVLVPLQYRTDQGYPGWMRVKFLEKLTSDAGTKTVTVAYPVVSMRSEPSVDAPVVEKVFLSTRLSVDSEKLSEGEKWYQVSVVDDSLWVRASQVVVEKPLQPGQGLTAVNLARRFEGTPYLWGGMTQKGIDCSGLMYTVFRTHGITVPRDADQQFQVGRAVEKDDLLPGDMVFFGQPGDISHVGMYAGDGNFVHASSGAGVIESVLFQGWYLQHYRGARRVLEKFGPELRKLEP